MKKFPLVSMLLLTACQSSNTSITSPILSVNLSTQSSPFVSSEIIPITEGVVEFDVIFSISFRKQIPDTVITSYSEYFEIFGESLHSSVGSSYYNGMANTGITDQEYLKTYNMVIYNVTTNIHNTYTISSLSLKNNVLNIEAYADTGTTPQIKRTLGFFVPKNVIPSDISYQEIDISKEYLPNSDLNIQYFWGSGLQYSEPALVHKRNSGSLNDTALVFDSIQDYLESDILSHFSPTEGPSFDPELFATNYLLIAYLYYPSLGNYFVSPLSIQKENEQFVLNINIAKEVFSDDAIDTKYFAFWIPRDDSFSSESSNIIIRRNSIGIPYH
jgi:hypothetical protein